MEYEAKIKNVYDLEYQTTLNYLNIFLAGIFGLWITFIFQTNISDDYKWIMSAVMINLIFMALIIFYYKARRLKSSILNLK